MPLDFPSSPTNGQTYENYIFDSSITAWRNQGSPSGLAGQVVALDNKMGLKNVVPTSVAVSGGSATVNSKGKVTFTSTASLSLNGVFTDTFTNYSIVISNVLATADVWVYGRMRSAGTDNLAKDYYHYNMGYSNSTQFNNFEGAGTNDFWRLGITSAHGTRYAAELTFYSPKVARPTDFTGIVRGNYAGNSIFTVVGAYDNNGSYDGITIYPSGGTFSGEITIYGWNE